MVPPDGVQSVRPLPPGEESDEEERRTAIIVDDHRLLDEAIASVLGRMGIRVLGLVSTLQDAVELAGRHHPTIVLVDLQLSTPEGDGRRIAAHLLEAFERTTVLALTASADLITDADLKAGYGGFLLKEGSLSRFERSISAALEGDAMIPVPVGRRRNSYDREGVSLLAGQLTGREEEVLELLVQGVSGRAIAARLDITPNTVRSHVQSILSKLQVHSRLEAAAFAVHHGLVDVSANRSGRRAIDRDSA